MSEHENDLDGGGRTPTTEQVCRISAHLQTRNQDWGPRPTHRELQARNFAISVATVQRILKKADVTQKVGDTVAEAKTRVKTERTNNRNTKENTSAAAYTKQDTQIDEGIVRGMAALLEASNTSAFLAIEENRTRMALNIVIAEAMAAKANLLLLDMRGTAALVDALTCAAKLSGGAALDIKYPTEAEKKNAADGYSPEGHVMKDITPGPKSPFATSLEQFRQNRRHTNGNGTGT